MLVGFSTGYYTGKKITIVPKTDVQVSKPESNNQQPLAPSYDPLYWTQNAYKAVTIPQSKKCQTSDNVAKEEYLITYTVAKGESFSTISQKVFHTPARTRELMVLNGQGYASSNMQNINEQTFLEIGWVLYLAPKFVHQTTGLLSTWKGELIEESDQTWTLLTGNAFASTIRVIHKSEDIVFFGKSTFHKGDCVTVLLDMGDTYKTLAISPQDSNYFREASN